MNGSRLAGIKVEQITAVGALLVGLAALFVAWEESRIMRETQRAQALPIVVSDNDISVQAGETRYTLSLTNKGVGPALIRNVKFLNDQGMEQTSIELVESAVKKIPQSVFIGGSDVPGFTLSPQESLSAITLTWNEGNAQIVRTLYDVFVNAQYVVCYCSVFDECWESRKVADPVPVKSCPLQREDYTTSIMDLMTSAADADESTENERDADE